MMDVVGIVQHHDAITGTARDEVNHDYRMRISNAVELTKPVYSSWIEKIAEQSGFQKGNW